MMTQIVMRRWQNNCTCYEEQHQSGGWGLKNPQDGLLVFQYFHLFKGKQWPMMQPILLRHFCCDAIQSGAWALEMSPTRPLILLHFREIRKKRSHWPGCQSDPLCKAVLPQISLHLDTTSWLFNLALKHHLLGNSNLLVWLSITLGLHKWPDSDKCLKWAMLV